MEDFTKYTEVDPNSRITVATRRVTWTDLDRNETAYVYKDNGADYFNGNFTHLLTITLTTVINGTYIYGWALTNTVGGLKEIDAADGDFLGLFTVGTLATDTIGIAECDGGTIHPPTAWAEAELDTPYYLKIVRNESVGDYGTLYCYIYSDAGRTTLLSTLTLTLHTSKKDFRYIFGASSWDSNDTPYAGSGYTENLDLFGPSDPNVLPTVTTQTTSDVESTTATGNGIIVDLGLSSVSQHGHCWDITIDPTTTDSSSGKWGKTSNGAGSVGDFTSSITGLLAGQLYFCRAYATNTQGTAYGANTAFTAGYKSTPLIQGNLAIVQERLHYIDANGVERYITGAKA